MLSSLIDGDFGVSEILLCEIAVVLAAVGSIKAQSRYALDRGRLTSGCTLCVVWGIIRLVASLVADFASLTSGGDDG